MGIEALQRDSGELGSSVEPRYRGATTVARFEFGTEAIKLARPADPDRLLDDPAVLDWNRRDDYMPYWAYLWPGAYLLADAVARQPWLSSGASPGSTGPRALEIGCGLGLSGLVAVAHGLSVHFTDYDPAPLEFVAMSAAINGFAQARYSRGLLDWRDLPAERYQIILGADVIYERRLVPLVADLLATMLAPGGLGLIASPYRVAAEDFPAAVRARALGCTADRASARAEDGRLCEGTIYRVTAHV